MPRQPRLDAPGTLHQVMGRGIEGKDTDREDFLSRLGELCQEGFLAVYAWSLMENHLLVRTRHQPLSKNMRNILTGYVINLNRRKRKYPGAEVARFLGVTTSAVIRAAYSEELPELHIPPDQPFRYCAFRIWKGAGQRGGYSCRRIPASRPISSHRQV